MNFNESELNVKVYLFAMERVYEKGRCPACNEDNVLLLGGASGNKATCYTCCRCVIFCDICNDLIGEYVDTKKSSTKFEKFICPECSYRVSAALDKMK